MQILKCEDKRGFRNFIKVLLDLNYVNKWYLMSSINFVYTYTWFAAIIWVGWLFNDWYKYDVMWCMLEWCWIECWFLMSLLMSKDI